MRTALGASRWRIVRQLILEGVALALVGGSHRLGDRVCTRDVFQALLPDDMPGESTWSRQTPCKSTRASSRCGVIRDGDRLSLGLLPALYVTRRGLLR